MSDVAEKPEAPTEAPTTEAPKSNAPETPRKVPGMPDFIQDKGPQHDSNAEIADDLYNYEPPDREETSDEPSPDRTAQPEQAPAPQPASSPNDEAKWSDQDVQTYAQLQSASQQFQQDLNQFAQIKNQAQQAMSQMSKEQAEAYKIQLQEAEQELKKRYGAIQQTTQYLQGKQTQRSQQQVKSKLEQEKQALKQKMPDLDKSELKRYLKQQGFTDKDIKQAADHRLVTMAEKARRYDEMVGSQSSGKGKKAKKPVQYRDGKGPEETGIEHFDRLLDLYPDSRFESTLAKDMGVDKAAKARTAKRKPRQESDMAGDMYPSSRRSGKPGRDRQGKFKQAS